MLFRYFMLPLQGHNNVTITLINMKRLMLLAIPAMLLASCNSHEYKITGKAGEDMEGKLVRLKNDTITVDSCTITNGAFTFKGSVNDQTMYMLAVEQGAEFPVFIENGAKINVDLNESPASIKDNGGMNDSYADVINAVNEAGEALNERVEKLIKAGVPYTGIQDSLASELDALKNIYRDGISANKGNYVGAFLLNMVAREFYQELGSLDSVMAEVKYAVEMKQLQALRKTYESAESTREGRMFVDFTGQSVDGTSSKLSDYVGKGKFVLVDFWASWCGPCKREIPNLLDLYSRFNGENFTVLGVNVWDAESRFKAALESEGITYPQIFVPRDNEDDATELYGIQGIPQIILFGPDGTIVKRDLRGEEMKEFVAGQLQK